MNGVTLSWLSLDEAMQQPPRDWLVLDLIPASGVVALVGGSGVGKSFVALDLAARLAAGCKQWMGHKLKGSSNVVYVSTNAANYTGQRLRAWLEANDRQSIGGISFAHCYNPAEQDVFEFIANVVTQMSESDKVLVIDSLDALCAQFGDSNRKSEVVRVLAQMDLCVILVDHLDLGVAGFPSIDNVEAYDSIVHTADSVIAIHQPYQSRSKRCLSVLKTRDADRNSFQVVNFNMNQIRTGRTDNLGRPEYSLVPVYCRALGPQRVTRKSRYAQRGQL